MKISPRLLAFALVALLTFSGGLVFAQSAAVSAYRQGLEDLQNNLIKDAITKFETGLNDALSGSNPLPDTHEDIVALRYGYAYALVQDRRLFDAIMELDVLVESAPDMDQPKYLLGVTLMLTMSNENVLRGMDTLKRYEDESADPNARTIAMNTSAQLAYNISTAEYAGGDPGAAAALLNGLFNNYGQTPGRDKAENNHIRYAIGIYLKDSGDIDGAMFELDYLAVARKAKDYALKNGTTLNQVRADVYYQAALGRLAEGGQTGGEGALAMIKALGKIEGAGGPNAHHVTHAKALAYAMAGNEDAMKREINSLRGANPAYYKSVTK